MSSNYRNEIKKCKRVQRKKTKKKYIREEGNDKKY